MDVLPLPALSNVAVSLPEGYGEARQLTLLVHAALDDPFHVPLAARAERMEKNSEAHSVATAVVRMFLNTGEMNGRTV